MMQSVKGRTPLQPKRLNPNTGVRLQLKAHGYDIIPLNTDKIPFKGWPTQPNDEAAIRKWGGRRDRFADEGSRYLRVRHRRSHRSGARRHPGGVDRTLAGIHGGMPAAAFRRGDAGPDRALLSPPRSHVKTCAVLQRAGGQERPLVETFSRQR